MTQKITWQNAPQNRENIDGYQVRGMVNKRLRYIIKLNARKQYRLEHLNLSTGKREQLGAYPTIEAATKEAQAFNGRAYKNPIKKEKFNTPIEPALNKQSPTSYPAKTDKQWAANRRKISDLIDMKNWQQELSLTDQDITEAFS